MSNRNNNDTIININNKLTIALCGNPNSGKTTLFNALTGSNQKVGNWPGVTVERKLGVYKQDTTVTIADTPGIYSLSPFTIDEQVAHKYLMEEHPDLIINTVDSTSLERGLFLTSQLLELDIPMVVALNMQDEAKAKGITINVDALQKEFGCKFFSISASKGQGIDELMRYCIAGDYAQKNHFTYSDEVECAIDKIDKLVNGSEHKHWVALKLLEKDPTMISLLKLTDEQIAYVKQINKDLSDKLGDIVSAKVVEQRYQRIEEVVKKSVKIDKSGIKQEKAQQVTAKIDKFVLNKWLAFPLFIMIMALVFFIAMGPWTGGLLTDLINDNLTTWLQNTLNNLLTNALGQGHWLTSLVVDGIIGGVMGVVGFVPQIMLLFGCIAILEASGYMSRIAFITDRMLNKIGLGGRSFVSMIIGCGCSVPAVMATRTIKNINERNTTITLTPFMPCSAKLAVISFVSNAMFPTNHATSALVAISFYFLSILAVITGGLVLKVFNRKKTNASDTFIMELPTYRKPTAYSVLKQMWERGKAFLAKAGTIILTASVLLWVLESFDFGFNYLDGNAENSMLASVGKIIAPVFAPIGFGDWRFAVATLSGIAAKETVVATLGVTLGDTSIVEALGSGIGAYTFVVYNLLTVPCVATISASFAEQGNWKNGTKSILFQLVTSYVVAFLIYQIGTLAINNTKTFVIAITLTAIAFVLYFSVRYLVKNKGCSYECDHCPHNESCTKK